MLASGLGSLNEEQYKSLSDFFFDLAKAAFAFAVFSPISPSVASRVVSSITGIILGVASLYAGLILLELKGKL